MSYGQTERAMPGVNACLTPRSLSDAKPDMPRELDMTADGIRSVFDRLVSIDIRLTSVLERLYGAQPTAQERTKLEAAPSCSAITRMNDAIADCHRRTEVILDHIATLERL